MAHVMEALLHSLLVVNHELPEAGGLRRVCDGEVGLQPHFALGSKRVRDLRRGFTRGRGEGLVTREQDLEEDLGVEGEGSRVEGDGLAVVDKCVRASDSVRCQKADELSRREASVLHTGEDHVDGVLRLRHETQGSGMCRVGATSHELKLRGTWAVGNGHCTSELDQIASGDIELLKQWASSCQWHRRRHCWQLFNIQ